MQIVVASLKSFHLDHADFPCETGGLIHSGCLLIIVMHISGGGCRWYMISTGKHASKIAGRGVQTCRTPRGETTWWNPGFPGLFPRFPTVGIATTADGMCRSV